MVDNYNLIFNCVFSGFLMRSLQRRKNKDKTLSFSDELYIC